MFFCLAIQHDFGDERLVLASQPALGVQFGRFAAQLELQDVVLTDAAEGLTVRPPRLGGNERVGVFASRSPYRPNPLGLSSVRIEKVDADAGQIHVLGADLADGTPVYDIKPYVEYADSHPGVRSGFVDAKAWQPLEVFLPRDAYHKLEPAELDALTELLAQDPRPQYQDDPERIYGLLFGDRNIRFRVAEGTLTVIEIN